MTFISGKYYRNSLRLRDYDYSQNGMYFVTICTHQMQCLFGRIKNGDMYLNEVGKIVNQYWQEITEHYPFVILGKYIIMPNHIHGIIQIAKPSYFVGAPLVGARGFVNIIGAFKSLTTNRYIQNVKAGKFLPFEKSLFQRNYYEHIVQDKFDLERIQEYIKKILPTGRMIGII